MTYTGNITTRSHLLFFLSKFLSSAQNSAGREVFHGYIDCHRIFSNRNITPLPPLSTEIPHCDLICSNIPNYFNYPEEHTVLDFDAPRPYVLHRFVERRHYISLRNLQENFAKNVVQFVNWTKAFNKMDDIFDEIVDECERHDFFRLAGRAYYDALVGRKDVICDLRADIVREGPLDSNLVRAVKFTLYALAVSEFATRLLIYQVLEDMRQKVSDSVALYRDKMSRGELSLNTSACLKRIITERSRRTTGHGGSSWILKTFLS
ncbi:hypothetical protein BDQ17DRAFT_1090540 [Cyathus striatus]|nr:hypothetical protein BDQ17DRAFT_1090540 [Cyathus striatus]